MIKKIFLKLNDRKSRYWMFEGAQTANFILQDLQSFLESKQYENLHLTKLKDKVLLWDSDYIKQQATDIFCNAFEEQQAFDKAYSAYSARRWADMPKIEMSFQNYEMLLEKWQKIQEEKPKYIILSHDEDTGYVDLVGKNELLQQDLADMKLEHEQCLKYQKAWEVYDLMHPNRSEIWRSPQDDEYEADWQQYLDKD